MREGKDGFRASRCEDRNLGLKALSMLWGLHLGTLLTQGLKSIV